MQYQKSERAERTKLHQQVAIMDGTMEDFGKLRAIAAVQYSDNANLHTDVYFFVISKIYPA
jgi:hypothetical protein